MFFIKRRITSASSEIEKGYSAASLTSHRFESVSVNSFIFGLLDGAPMGFGA